MIHITDVYALKAKLNLLKHKLCNENVTQKEKDFVDKYLNEVLFIVDSSFR
jgi:hypothetical protein